MNKIRTYRKKTKLTQAGFASVAGLSAGSFAHYEAGRRTPGLEECRQIVKAINTLGLDASLDDVFPPSRSAKSKAA